MPSPFRFLSILGSLGNPWPLGVPKRLRGGLLAAALALVASQAPAQSTTPPADTAPPTHNADAPAADDPLGQVIEEFASAGDDPLGQLIEAFNADDNAITIDRAARTVEIVAEVCLRECEFLEQLACSQGTREHESLIVLEAKPSMVHTALLLLGLEPGAPMRWVEEGDTVRAIAPRGPRIEILLITTDEEGEATATPANEWIADQKTGQVMHGNAWLFAGSKFVQVNGEEMYVADAYGTAISLVNFGDDMLVRETDLTDSNDSHNQVWGANTDAIPEVGTQIVVRLVLPPEADHADDGEFEEDPGQTPETGPEGGAGVAPADGSGR